ncbi:MAG: cell division protein FtsA [Dehalococcoidia bacterium]|nr:cell division protein FtsA [Dehalococcoidia bacterium]
MGRDSSKILIAIDVGTAQVSVAGARVAPDFPTEIVAYGTSASLGMHKAAVSSVDDASFAIRAALEDAGLEGKIRDSEVIVGVSGKHIASRNTTGEAAVERSDGAVAQRDVQRALASARSSGLGEDTALLHQIVRAYRVDGYRCRRDPVGMHGKTLQAETHLVTAGMDAVRNLKRAVEMAGKDVDRVVAGGLMSALAVLRREEREMGAVTLDIGHGVTDIVAYADGAVVHTSALPLGGHQLINDISIALNTSLHVSRSLLTEHGQGVLDPATADLEITVPCYGLSGERRARKRYLVEVIRLRLMELFQLSMGRVRLALPDASFTAGVVICGGVARLPGIQAIAEEALKMPARVGSVSRASNGPDLLQGPQFATLIGMVQSHADPSYAPVADGKAGQPAGGLRLLPQLLGSRS